MNLEDLAFDSLKRMPPTEAYSSLFDQLDDLISDQADATVNYLKNKDSDTSDIAAVGKKIRMLRRLKKRLDEENIEPTAPEDVRHLEL